MTSLSTTFLEQTVLALKQSPLFHLSLASKELFHSNLLAWLCETYPNDAGQLFAAFLKHAPLTCDLVKVDRERKNIDLWLEYASGEHLIVENKVKSLPIKSQLESYAAEHSDKAHTSFLLLSLTRPSFLSEGETKIRLPDGEEWHYVSYSDLANKLRNVVPAIRAKNGYHGQLLDDYIDFITHLDALQNHFIINWSEVDSNFFGVRKELGVLKSIRVHDLIDKMRYSQVAQRVQDALLKERFHIHQEDIWHGQSGQVSIAAGMTRGAGLVDLKYYLMHDDRFHTPVILGVQVQGDNFRLVLEVRKVGCGPKMANALWKPTVGSKVWFDFGLVTKASEEYPKNGEFNQYSGLFFHRSKRVAGMPPQILVDAMVEYARLIRENATMLRRQIESIL